MDAAGAEPCRVHAGARSALEEVQQSSRISNSHRFGVIAPTSMTCEPMLSMWLQMRVISANIVRSHGALGHFQIQQLFHRQNIGMLHAERRTIVQPVEIGQRLQIGLVFDQLFGAAMQQADMRIDTRDNFTVQFSDHAQHAVGGGC
jgi:hypothetical protein